MQDINYAPRPLSTSREYPGYQFYAVLRLAGRSADDCLRRAALTVQNWLCERIEKAGGSVPEPIRCPSPADYMAVRTDELASCQLPFAEIISVPARGVWALMVREPHPKIAARSFVTHVGIRALSGDDVEFGVYIDVVDRDGDLPEEDMVYRPQFIRLLFEAEGMALRQAAPLAFRAYEAVRDRRGVGRLKDLADDRANQLPIVAFTHARPSQASQAELARIIAEAMKASPPAFGLVSAPPVPPPAAAKASEPELPYDVREFARHTYGFAQVYVVAPEAFREFAARFSRARLREGDILVAEPKAFGGAVRVSAYREGLDAGWYKGTLDELLSSLKRYSKHKPYRFGDVLFVDGARQLVRQLELEAIRAGAHLENDAEQRRMFEQLERERALSADLARQNAELRDQKNREYQRGADNERRRAAELEDRIDKLRAENTRLKLANDAARQSLGELDAMQKVAARVQDTQEMPRTCGDVAVYFRRIFADRIDFTDRGMRSAAKCEINPDALWRCLYAVATVLVDLYRDGVRNVEKEFQDRTGWELAPSEGAQTRKTASFMDLRRDTYDGREISIEPHVKFSKSLRKTGAQYQRLYYAYDAYTRKVIVGYVGDHLENFLSLSVH